MVVTGECDPEVLEQFGGKVLGHIWHPQTDKLEFKLKVNLSGCNQKGERLSQDLTMDDLQSLKSIKLTKRVLLGFTNGIYDIAGLISPVTIKIELWKLFSNVNKDLEWDEEIPPENHASWVRLIEELLSMPAILTSRSVAHPESVGRPELFAFFDGSTDVYSTCIYVRWKIDAVEDAYSSSLLGSKAG